jgi:hypothetical protein
VHRERVAGGGPLMAAAYLVCLSDPRVGAPIETACASRMAAVETYRDQLATMWRRPSASLQLEHDGRVIASFRHYNPERHHFNGLLVRQREQGLR